VGHPPFLIFVIDRSRSRHTSTSEKSSPFFNRKSSHSDNVRRGAGIARKWIDTDHVDAIVDVPTSSVALAIQEVTREKKRLFLISGPASSDLSGKACSPYGIQWTYDTYALAHGTGGALVKQGGDSWFFITADYAFGHALERDTGEAVKNRDGPGAQAARPMICSIGRRQDDRFCSGKFGVRSQGSGQTNSVSCRDGTTADMIRAY